MQIQSRAVEPPEWQQERFRYRVLRSIYDFAGASATRIVSDVEMTSALDADAEELFEALDYLDQDGYLICAGGRRRICITPVGIAYIERLAGRRRSIRAPAPD